MHCKFPYYEISPSENTKLGAYNYVKIAKLISDIEAVPLKKYPKEWPQ